MGRDQHARHAEQRALRAGLLLEHVECHTRDDATLQAFHERLFLVDAPAGAIDEPDTRLERFEILHADEILCFLGERRVDREVVDLRQQVAGIGHQLHAEFRGAVGREERIEAHDVHVEGPSPLRDGLADAAEAHDAERLARQLHAHEFVAVPGV